MAAVLPVIVPVLLGYTLTWRDTARIHAPLRSLVVDALRDFRLPLWNPYESTGVPLLAQMVHGVLHPVSLVAALAVPRAGTDVLIVAHVAVAAAGAALLTRQIGASPTGAVTAGVAFALSGYVLSMSSVLHYLAAAATAPWAVAALRGAAGTPLGVAIGIAAIAVGALHFAGDPQWTLLAALLGAVLATERARLRGLAAAAVAIALGSALAGIQLLPTWAHLQESARGTIALGAVERTRWALAPWRLVELAAPGFFSGRPGVSLSAPVFLALGDSHAGVDSFWPTYATPFVPSVSIGAVVLILATLGATTTRATRVVGAAAAVFVWLALGTRLGADQALHWIPVWGSFRYAEKMVGPFTLCCAVLAGMAASRVHSPATRRATTAVTAVSIVTSAVAAWLWVGGGHHGYDGSALVRRQLAGGVTHAAASTAALALLLAVSRRVPTSARHMPGLVAAVVFVAAVAAVPFAIHPGAHDAREPRPLAGLTGAADVVRIATPLRGVLPDTRGGLPDTRGVLPDTRGGWLDRSDAMLALESRMGVTPYAAPTGIDQIDTYTALIPWARILVDNALGWNRRADYWTAMRRYAITHIVLRPPQGPLEAARAEAAVAGGRRLFDVPSWGYSVWEVPHRPWAAFVERVVAVDTAEEAVRILRTAAERGEPDAVVEGWSPEGGFPPRMERGRVLGIRRGGETLRIEADVKHPGVLVVNDAYAPGWVATLDGHPLPIMRADVLVRAVPWPAGFRVLEMRYDPPEVRAGLWITAVAAVTIAVLVLGSIPRGVVGTPWPRRGVFHRLGHR